MPLQSTTMLLHPSKCHSLRSAEERVRINRVSVSGSVRGVAVVTVLCLSGHVGVQRTCKGHAKGVQRTCKGRAKDSQRTRKGRAKDVQRACKGRASAVFWGVMLGWKAPPQCAFKWPSSLLLGQDLSVLAHTRGERGPVWPSARRRRRRAVVAGGPEALRRLWRRGRG